MILMNSHSKKGISAHVCWQTIKILSFPEKSSVQMYFPDVVNYSMKYHDLQDVCITSQAIFLSL